MRKKAISIIDQSHLQLIFVFIFLCLCHSLDVFSLPFDYGVFIFLLPVFALVSIRRARHLDTPPNRWVWPTLSAAFLFALLIRLVPQAGGAVPLGYDPGFYKYTLELYFDFLPLIPEAELAEWIQSMYPQGLFILSDATHTIAGTDSSGLIDYSLPFVGAVLVFPVYLVTRELFGWRAGLISALLYAVSYAQFEVFNLFYLKNDIGLILLLLSIYSLEKGKYALMSITFAGLGIFHRPEFLLFALILLPYFILNRRKEIVLAALVTAVLIIPFWITRLDINWDVLTGTIGRGIGYEDSAGKVVGGTFIDFRYYREVSLVYIPFAVMGAIWLGIKRKWNSVFFYFIIVSSIVVFEIFFFRRFIIPLDIVFIILAAVGIECTILKREGLPRLGALLMVILIVISAAIPTVDWARDTRPLISEDALAAAEWIRDNTEGDACVVATSYDAPWVLGWSERRVIAPGLFEWNQHDRGDWGRFLVAEGGDFVNDFLDVYEGPIYIYSSQSISGYLKMEKFENERFEKVYSREALVYKYLGGDEI